jgi:hypothetical protein
VLTLSQVTPSIEPRHRVNTVPHSPTET